MYNFKKITSTALSAALCVGLTTGCTIGKGTANVMTVDGTDVPAGIYLYYAYSAYSQAVSYLTSQDSELDSSDKKALKALTIDGKDTETWIQDKASELCEQYVAIEKKFDELNLELSDEDNESIDTYAENYMSYYGDAFEKAGVSEDSMKKVIASSFKNVEVFNYYYEVGGEEGIEESEYYDYYKENNARVRILTFNKQDGSGEALEDDALEDFEDMIDGYYDRIEKCKTEDEQESMIDEIESEYEEYSSEQAELATAETDEDGNYVTEEDTTDEDTSEEDTTEDTSEDVTDTTEEDTSEESSEEDSVSDEDTSAEEDSTSEDTDEEDSTDDETSEEDTTSEDDTTEEETTTTSPYANEEVIEKTTTTTDIAGNEPEEDDITYSPSKSVQQALFETDNENYIANGELKLINDDETEYIILRRDIEERMTDDDLWTDDQISTVATNVYSDAYEEMLEGWADSYDTKKNNSAYRRYDVFEIDLYGQDSSNS